MCIWCMRARLRCLYVFFQFVTSVCVIFCCCFFFSLNIIYEFYLIFRKRIIRPLNFFFVSSTLFHSSAYSSWLHRSNVETHGWLFYIFTAAAVFFSFFFLLFNWLHRSLRAFNSETVACAYIQTRQNWIYQEDARPHFL